MIETPKDVSSIPEDAQTTASGLAYKVLKASDQSDSNRPKAADTVTVHYSGWTTDGKLFDSSVQRGQPASFPLNRVIKGWTEGLQLMQIGESVRFWIPADLAYGENAGGGRLADCWYLMLNYSASKPLQNHPQCPATSPPFRTMHPSQPAASHRVNWWPAVASVIQKSRIP